MNNGLHAKVIARSVTDQSTKLGVARLVSRDMANAAKEMLDECFPDHCGFETRLSIQREFDNKLQSFLRDVEYHLNRVEAAPTITCACPACQCLMPVDGPATLCSTCNAGMCR